MYSFLFWSTNDTQNELFVPKYYQQAGDHRLKEGGLEEDEDLQRVWLWVHPAGAKEALREIRKACLLEGAPWVGMVEVCVGYLM